VVQIFSNTRTCNDRGTFGPAGSDFCGIAVQHERPKMLPLIHSAAVTVNDGSGSYPMSSAVCFTRGHRGGGSTPSVVSVGDVLVVESEGVSDASGVRPQWQQSRLTR
jgi:hypothetical protein